MKTETYIFLITASLILLATTPSWASEGCPDDKWCADKETAIQVRDKARAFEAICDNTYLSPDTPERIRQLCDDESTFSDLLADAETKEEHASTNRELQRKANLCQGSLSYCKTKRKGQSRRISNLEARIPKRSGASWTFIGACGGSVAAGLARLLLADKAKGRLEGGLTIGVGLTLCGVGLKIP